jgi:hypothetical protein
VRRSDLGEVDRAAGLALTIQIVAKHSRRANSRGIAKQSSPGPPSENESNRERR